ncbi:MULTISPECIES: DUF1648 domain-containing protein [Chryseobacterium]|uniref:Membrane protein n=1 Tax=Chryseobacterium camelliae TaxID=1265445 RepID=A0ABU0TL99_9FLAO|nr:MULTISPECIES: DUF1648 domain-containing protein [Chryseobacterium]MDQ1097791.1 putative membrane protein [Chryseobacterium camelliae]MDQ1101723.1 putative membrane protein [Chryseobacterium sp. SORGH_AS_1048]MDR6085162.1 putative membrane protein [Chryseobacterium sp. SORGH_AS_0909]MDR6129520.1 putative membrane protein [Chryseobacterium sp. SORGH_AS_1175]
MDSLFLIFDIVNLGLAALLWWITIKNYSVLPDTIPTHFDFEGKADHFGNKKFSFLLPVLAIVCYIAFAIILHYAGAGSNSVVITDKNRDAQLFIMMFFMRWLLMLIFLIFLNIQDYTIRYTADTDAKPRFPLMASVFMIIASVIVLFIFVGVFK